MFGLKLISGKRLTQKCKSCSNWNHSFQNMVFIIISFFIINHQFTLCNRYSKYMAQIKIIHIIFSKLFLLRDGHLDLCIFITSIACSLSHSFFPTKATSWAFFTPLSEASLVTEKSFTHLLNREYSS